MERASFTIADAAESLKTSQQIARGLVLGLVAAGYLEECGYRKRIDGKPGKPSKMFRIASTANPEALLTLLDTLSPVESAAPIEVAT